jgi:hypothetical protein
MNADLEDMDEMELLVAENDDSEETMQVCPTCGSPDLYYEAGGVEGLYHCKYCSYIGSFVIDANEEMARLIRKEYDSEARHTE